VAGLEPATPGFGERASAKTINTLQQALLSNRMLRINVLAGFCQTAQSSTATIAFTKLG
jgi:hypothetical protein